jgi:hypothetical protein
LKEMHRGAFPEEEGVRGAAVVAEVGGHDDARLVAD